jgi:DNA-binding NtrC family response regulator
MARLLVVDDEKNRDTLGRFLGSRQHEIALVESGRDALTLMDREGPFDLVLSDWRMAKMNGLELLTAIKARLPATIAAASDATILLTGESGTGKNVLARQIHEWSSRTFSISSLILSAARPSHAPGVLKLGGSSLPLRRPLNRLAMSAWRRLPFFCTRSQVCFADLPRSAL